MPVEIPIRIVFVDAPPGVQYSLRKGKDELVAPRRSTGGDLPFELALTLKGQQPDGSPNFSGCFANGTPTERFVRINIGTIAGDWTSCWTRAAKIPISGITWELVEEVQATPGAVIEGRFPGRSKRDGSPSCATIHILDNGWKIKTE
jgi:hypothetical protein